MHSETSQFGRHVLELTPAVELMLRPRWLQVARRRKFPMQLSLQDLATACVPNKTGRTFNTAAPCESYEL